MIKKIADTLKFRNGSRKFKTQATGDDLKNSESEVRKVEILPHTNGLFDTKVHHELRCDGEAASGLYGSF